MVFKTKTAINSLVACVAASLLCACSQAAPGDGQAGQDTPKPPITSESPVNAVTEAAEISDPKSSRFSTFATATTFEAIGITPRSYCERSDPTQCGVDVLPISTVDEREVPELSNPHRLVRQDSAFERAISYEGSNIFPADLDPQFIAYYAPNHVLSDGNDEAGPSEIGWYETALLPVTWYQTGCSGIMGITMYRGTDHPRDSAFFVGENGGIGLQTFFSYGQTSVELTASGYRISTEYDETDDEFGRDLASLTLAPDDKGRCVATVETNE